MPSGKYRLKLDFAAKLNFPLETSKLSILWDNVMIK